MPEPELSEQLRRRIQVLQTRRRSLESKLLQPRSMIAASLVERFLGTGSARRSSPAYYLSRSLQGRSQLSYVKKAELDATRQRCEAYRSFQQNLAAWWQLTAELEGLWKRLQQSQVA